MKRRFSFSINRLYSLKLPRISPFNPLLHRIGKAIRVEMTPQITKKINSGLALALIIGILLGVSPAARALFGMSRGGTTSNGGQSQRQPSALGDSAVAYYPFDDGANDKAPVNRNNLTDNNTVTQAAGRTPNAGQFTSASSESLSITDNTALSTGDIDFTFSAWVYSDDAISSFRTILSKYNQDNVNTEYFLGYDSTVPAFQFSVYNGSAGIGSVNATTFGAASATTWYFVTAWHDASANTVNIQINNGTVDSAATTGGAGDSTSPFRIGAYSDNGGTARSFWNGRIDNVGFWKRTLTTGERSWLYNTGQGRGYSELEAGFKTSLQAYWNLNEAASTRLDSHSTNNLTDNNTVTFAAGVNQTKASKAASLSNTSNESLSVADNASISVGNADFTLAGWVYNNNVDSGVSSYALSKYGASNIEYYVGLDDTSRRLFIGVSGDGTNVTTVQGPVIKSATWYFIVIWYDSVADTINYQVNNETATSSSQSTGIFDGTSALYFGALNGSTSNDWDGRIDNFGFWKRTLNTEERASLYNSGLGQDYRALTNPLKNNLISWWDMDEPSGTRNDTHAYSGLNNGTVTGATQTTGKFSNAYSFNGTSDYISVADSSSLEASGTKTVSAWVKTSSSSDQSIASKYRDDTAEDGWSFYLSSGTVGGIVKNSIGTGVSVATSTTVNDGNWHHVAMTWDTNSGTIKIYIDGALSTTSGALSGTYSGNTRALSIGRRINLSDATNIPFNGSIDEVRIYSRVLPLAEIARQFQGSKPVPIDNTASAYYKMDEASGTVAKDASHGTNAPNPLTDNNTVTQATGRQPNAGQFTSANSEFLSKADNAALSTGDIDFSIAAWVYLDSNSQGAIVSKYNTGTIEYGLFYQTGENRFILYVSSNGTGGGLGYVFANNFGAPSTGTWYFVTAWHDSSANTINISVNNGSANSTSHTTGVFDGTADFNIGASGNGTGNFWNGRIANVGFWKKVLTSAERTSLYNTGTGKMYQDLGTDEKTSLTSYWNLNEASGTRNDAHSTNNLTDNNTVTAKPNSAYKDSDTAAQFTVANSEYLTVADNANVSTGDVDFSASAWVYIDSKSSTRNIVSKVHSATASQREFQLYHTNTSDRFAFAVYDSSGGVDTVTANTFGAPSLSTWYFVVAWHDTVNDQIGISVNGTSDTASSTRAVNDSTTAFAVGGLGDTAGSMWDGRISNVGFWKKALSTGERASLYNGGGGKNYNKLSATDKDRLVSYWNLDEASSTRADSQGSNTLTDNNTVTSNSGVPSARYANAGQFTAANSEYLSRVHESSLDVGDEDFTWSGWIYADSLSGTDRGIIIKGTGPNTGDATYSLYYHNSSGNFKFFAGDADSVGQTTASTFGTVPTGQWMFVIAWHDATANTVNISVNNGATDSVSYSGGVGGLNKPVEFGRAGQAGTHWDGRIDNVGFWKRTLTSDEKTALYNSGIGKSYGDLSGGDKASLISWWDLDESEATRGDAHGGNSAYVNGPTVGKEGVFGNAYSFDGSDYVLAGDSASLDITGAGTFSGWVKLSTLASNQVILAKGDTGSGANFAYGLQYDSGGFVRFIVSSNGSTLAYRDSSRNLTTDTWYHLAGVYDGSGTLSVYINGVLLNGTLTGSIPSSLNNSAASLYLGANVYNAAISGYVSNGSLDDIRIYARALTANEVVDQYNAGAKQL